jgi:hypothetical protein
MRGGCRDGMLHRSSTIRGKLSDGTERSRGDDREGDDCFQRHAIWSSGKMHMHILEIALRGVEDESSVALPRGEAVQRLLRQIELPPAHLQEYHCWITFGSTSDVWHTASSPVSVDTMQAMPSSEKISLRRSTIFGPPSASAPWSGSHHVCPTIKFNRVQETDFESCLVGDDDGQISGKRTSTRRVLFRRAV